MPPPERCMSSFRRETKAGKSSGFLQSQGIATVKFEIIHFHVSNFGEILSLFISISDNHY